MKLETIQDIKTAVDAGKVVKCNNGSYSVIKDSLDQYFIKFDGSDHVIGLHGAAGTEYADKLNGSNFHTIEPVVQYTVVVMYRYRSDSFASGAYGVYDSRGDAQSALEHLVVEDMTEQEYPPEEIEDYIALDSIDTPECTYTIVELFKPQECEK